MTRTDLVASILHFQKAKGSVYLMSFSTGYYSIDKVSFNLSDSDSDYVQDAAKQIR